jgi:hypothetical protein
LSSSSEEAREAKLAAAVLFILPHFQKVERCARRAV